MQVEMSPGRQSVFCYQQYGAKTNASNLACHLKEYAAFSKGLDAENPKEVGSMYSPMDSDGVKTALDTGLVFEKQRAKSE